MSQRFCIAECCFVRSRSWARIGAVEVEVARRALLVADGRANLTGSAKLMYDKMRHPNNLNQAVICEDCRERLGESIALGEDVVSLRSNIKRGGYGLFVVVDKLAGEWLTNYGGEIMNKMEVAGAIARGLEVSHFVMVTRAHTINGQRNYRETVPGVRWKGLAQFINRWSNSREECNVRWKKDAPTLCCKALAAKPLAAGTELLAHYEIFDLQHQVGRNKVVKEKRLHVKLKRQVPANFDVQYRGCLMSTPRSRRSKPRW